MLNSLTTIRFELHPCPLNEFRLLTHGPFPEICQGLVDVKKLTFFKQPNFNIKNSIYIFPLIPVLMFKKFLGSIDWIQFS